MNARNSLQPHCTSNELRLPQCLNHSQKIDTHLHLPRWSAMADAPAQPLQSWVSAGPLSGVGVGNPFTGQPTWQKHPPLKDGLIGVGMSSGRLKYPRAEGL